MLLINSFRCDEPVACAYVIFLLRHDEHDLRRDEQLRHDEGMVRRDEVTWYSSVASFLLIFLLFLHHFAQFSLKICKTQSNEGLEHYLEILV